MFNTKKNFCTIENLFIKYKRIDENFYMYIYGKQRINLLYQPRLQFLLKRLYISNFNKGTESKRSGVG